MHGQLFEIFDTVAPSYFVLILVGFLFATTMGALWAKQVGQNPDVIVDLGLLSLIAGFAGARILHVFADGYFMDYVHLCTDPSLVDWHISKAECASEQYAGRWDAARNVCHPVETDCFAWANVFSGGFVFYGGLIGATAAAWWLFKRDRFPWYKAIDMGALMVPIGMGFGRLGCLLAGCCFGITSEGPLALRFPRWSPASSWQAREGLLDSHALPSLHVHPTQIYESAAAFAIAAFGILYFHGRKRYDGHVMVAFLTLYGIARFSLEFLRSDDRGGWILSTSQWISLGMLGAAFWLHRRRSRAVARKQLVPSAPNG